MISGTTIGDRYAATSFDTFEATNQSGNKALEACKRLASGKSDGVILCGPVGTGKTHLLISTVKEFNRLRTYIPAEESGPEIEVPPIADLMAGQYGEVDRSAPYLTRAEISVVAKVHYWMILDLAKALRDDALDSHGTMTEECMTCHLLVIDDLGREKESEFLRQEIERVIDFRYRQMLPTAIATNHKLDELYDVYGEHMMSRLQQSCEIVEVLGNDYRRKS